MKNFMYMMSLILLMGCAGYSTPVQKLDPAVYYKNDICISYYAKINGKTKKVKNCGVGLLPYWDKYDLKVESYGKLNFFAMTTCHRDDTTENPDRGIFRKNGVTKVKYIPTVEKQKDCPLYISAYNRSQKHAFGIFPIRDKRYKLWGTTECNGIVKKEYGASICQSKAGLLQKITFKEEVRALKPVSGAAMRRADCPSIASKTKDNKTFEYILPERECIYGFITKDKKVHKHYTIGYEDIIVRD